MKKKNFFDDAKMKRKAFYIQGLLMTLNISVCYGMNVNFGLRDMMSLS
jgi:hypothetical protein